jgi:hypothetical protein
MLLMCVYITWVCYIVCCESCLVSVDPLDSHIFINYRKLGENDFVTLFFRQDLLYRSSGNGLTETKIFDKSVETVAAIRSGFLSESQSKLLTRCRFAQ